MKTLLTALILAASLPAQNTGVGGRSCGVTLRYSGTATACTQNAKLTIHQIGLPQHGNKPAVLMFGAGLFPTPYIFRGTGCFWYLAPFHLIPCWSLPASGSVSWNSGAYPCAWVGHRVWHQFIVLTPRGLVTSNWGFAKVVRG